MKVVESDKLKSWIDANSFEHTTPIPPEPPTPPIPPIPPQYPILPWNYLAPFGSINVGQELNYSLPQPDPGKTRIEIMIIPVDMTTEVFCEFIFPDLRTWTQRLVYGMSSNVFKFRSQRYWGGYPNLPDQYLPEGNYTLKIKGLGGGTIRIQTKLE